MAYTIRQILRENWSGYLQANSAEDYQVKEVEKAINCSEHSCNSRICPSCGKRYTDRWSDKLQDYLIPVEHKHVVLTVPAVLRPMLRDWDNVGLLMDSSRSFFRGISS
ncbi:transposase zinc-binding domain-containing protein [Candidatus Woesearchaeota archaeon]|nr:transposase zinc-binding domain-containing protein [Candidatus Woesearchaeota archaeon]